LLDVHCPANITAQYGVKSATEDKKSRKEEKQEENEQDEEEVKDGARNV